MNSETVKGICAVDQLLREVRLSECNKCGKCVFGYEGITQLDMIINDITEKKGKNADLELMTELAALMKTQSACEKGEEIAMMVISSLNHNQVEWSSHINKKGCPAQVCKKYLEFYILPDKCIGCNDCVDACDDEAILGKRRFIHVIDQDECTQCGDCVDACDEEAIIIAGKIKPRVPKKPIPVKR